MNAVWRIQEYMEEKQGCSFKDCWKSVKYKNCVVCHAPTIQFYGKNEDHCMGCFWELVEEQNAFYKAINDE